MPGEFNQVKYQNEYNKQKYDRITMLVPKGEKEVIKEAAKKADISVNELMLRAVREWIEQQKGNHEIS